MMITYKLIKDIEGTICAVNCSDGTSIPFDPDNTDYQDYLAWVAEGNLPSPADLVEPSQASVTPLPSEEQA
jgi:hypothetical protein